MSYHIIERSRAYAETVDGVKSHDHFHVAKIVTNPFVATELGVFWRKDNAVKFIASLEAADEIHMQDAFWVGFNPSNGESR